MVNMKLKSRAFEEGDSIPSKYTCDGADKSPPLELEDIPDDAKTIALIVEDPDAPKGTWTHWVVFNIDASDKKIAIEEDTNPGTLGWNDFKRTGYGGPCPPKGEHRYFFRAFALDKKLDLEKGASRPDIEKAMKDHIVAKSVLMGRYKREGG